MVRLTGLWFVDAPSRLPLCAVVYVIPRLAEDFPLHLFASTLCISQAKPLPRKTCHSKFTKSEFYHTVSSKFLKRVGSYLWNVVGAEVLRGLGKVASLNLFPRVSSVAPIWIGRKEICHYLLIRYLGAKYIKVKKDGQRGSALWKYMLVWVPFGLNHPCWCLVCEVGKTIFPFQWPSLSMQ